MFFLLFAGFAMLPVQAYAYSPLQCTSGSPDPGTSLYDDSSSGACQFTGIQYIFSTVICQFVSMINHIMGKLYCSIQDAVKPIIMALMALYVTVYGVQILMGTAQLTPAEFVTRIFKMCLVFWLATDSTFGVSAGINILFNFFIGFISDTTRWVIEILVIAAPDIDMNAVSPNDPGVTASFKFLDEWIYNALTGSLSQSNAKVIGFFVAMGAAMPSIAFMGFYWLVSLAKMLISTLISFLMAVVAIAFLLGLSPIFIGFMLFQATFSYFDQWLRFMMSYALQVMISFAILTLWIFSMTLFGPFFNELSDILFSYEKIIRPAAAIYTPSDTWGLCPTTVVFNPVPHARCEDPNFNPRGSVMCNRTNGMRPCYVADSSGNVIEPPVSIDFTATPNATGKTKATDDYNKIIPPSKVPELSKFLYYIFYHMISLIIVSYGFASLQKNAKDIAKQLAGPSFVPILNKPGMSNANAGDAQEESKRFMSKQLFSGFDRRHETQKTPYETMVGQIKTMGTKR